jgi:predicted ATPase/CheY-like chemotaxis protein
MCSAEHPLVLFLDDLQWADAASLRLLRLMLADPDAHHLLIIGAYRDSEVDAAHPLATVIDALRAGMLGIEHIALGPLGIEHVREHLARTLERSQEDCAELADLVVARTAGNPFFVNQFLRALHQDGLLAYDHGRHARHDSHDRRGWRWDIATLGITDNVVELMVERMRKLPTPTQRALERAACVGNSFDVDTLALVCEDDPAALHGHLAPAIELGLVQPLPGPEARPWAGGASLPLAGSHAFAHDRVQQAAYALLSERERPALHLRIGRLLVRALPPDEQGRRIFELAEHSVLGVALVEDPEERLLIARTCLAAGRRALQAMAHETALRFLHAALALLPADGWHTCYELQRDLALATIEAEYLDAHFDAARRLSEDILTRARDLLDKVEVYDFQILFHVAQGRMPEALQVALEVLAMLGVVLPGDPDARPAYERALRDELALDQAGVEALARLPELAGGQPGEIGPTPVASAKATGTLRILIAEDNQINQLVAVRLLGLDGHDCAVAANGAEALDLLASEHFDVVLMDVQMPIMDGYTATREIRRREQGTGHRTPIVAVTAWATTEVVEACAAAGMDHFLSKPLRLEAMRDLLRQIQPRTTPA